MIQIKRAYEPPGRSDGTRILVDRLWPRGVRKDSAQIAEWKPELAPSAKLRAWYSHDPAKFARFRARYRTELSHRTRDVADLADRGQNGVITLVFAAKDPATSNAAVLKELLEESLR